MNTTFNICPNPNVLKSFSLGDLPAHVLDRLADHVAQCPLCNAELATMDHNADNLLDDLRQLQPAAATTISPALMEAARRAATAPAPSDHSSEITLDPGRKYSRLLSDGPCRLGKFELLSELGVGAFGYVFRGRDVELDRIVALKIQRAGALAGEEEIERFLREARSIAQLQHAGIVALYETGRTEEGVCFLVTEFIEGQTLEDRLKKSRPDHSQCAEWASQIALALQYAHEHGVIHRDVKPSNIMIDGDDRPHLTDFGLARRTSGELTMTSDGRIVGTPAYMSPEQARGESHHVDARSDIYSLGVILYEMLTGERPFQGARRLLLLQVLEDEPRAPRLLHPNIPRDLEVICLKAMAKSASRRYQTARELSDDLQRFLAGQPIRARPVGRPERLWRWCKRNSLAASLLFAITISFIIGFAYLSSLSTWFVRATALDSARNEVDMLETINAYYSELMDRIDKKKIRVTHEYLLKPGSLPLPATFTIDAGQRISKAESGMKVRLYSDYPWRADGGPKSDFERKALEILRDKIENDDPDLTYYQFTEIDGRPFVRYAKGQLIKNSCLSCHNNKKGDSPKKDWKKGDLVGVLAVTRPLDRDIARTRAGLGWAFILTAGVATGLVGLCLIFTVRRASA